MNDHRGARFFALAGIALLALLLYRFWFGESGWFAARELAAKVEAEVRLTIRYDERNRVLMAEVQALKDGFDAVEARARTDLGMIAEGETFYLVVDGDPGNAR
jgi:cell division protein FtsB